MLFKIPGMEWVFTVLGFFSANMFLSRKHVMVCTKEKAGKAESAQNRFGISINSQQGGTPQL